WRQQSPKTLLVIRSPLPGSMATEPGRSMSSSPLRSPSRGSSFSERWRKTGSAEAPMSVAAPAGGSVPTPTPYSTALTGGPRDVGRGGGVAGGVLVQGVPGLGAPDLLPVNRLGIDSEVDAVAFLQAVDGQDHAASVVGRIGELDARVLNVDLGPAVFRRRLVGPLLDRVVRRRDQP